MSLARCPGCGGDVAFSHPASVLSVCGYCQSVVRRLDVDLDTLGKVARPVEIDSPLRIGLRGSAYGGFTVVGGVQLDHGAGTWNEWYLGLDNGKWLWLAEAGRRFYLTAPAGPVADAPAFAKARVGRTVPLPRPPADSPTAESTLLMRVTEVHTATLVSARGELPFAITPNEKLRYADLTGPRKTFGTLDYGPPGTDEVVAYVGNEVTLADLKLDQIAGEPPQQPTLKAARLSCPQCDGSLELRAPDATLRVTCPFCRALIDTTGEKLRALATLDKAAAPDFPLGAKVTLTGQVYTVLGHMWRRDKAGQSTWEEYLLRPEGREGFDYLVCWSGHFTLVRPIHVGDVRGSSDTRVYEGKTYRHIESVTAVVESVQGEFPWAVSIGETARVRDFAREGEMLSLEESLGEHQELVASLGQYLEPAEVYTAFGRPGARDLRSMVVPHQINPHRARLRRRGRPFALGALVLLLMMAAFRSRAVLHQSTVSFDGATVPGVPPAAEHIFLSEPFSLGREGGSYGHLDVELRAGIDNSWFGADLALVNEDDGTAQAFSAETSYYHGYEGGESWSEGSQRATVWVPGIRAGRYVLRIEPAWPVGRPCEAARDCGSVGGAWECVSNSCERACDVDGLCAPGQTCQQARCVNAAVPYRVTLRYGEARTGIGFLLLLVMGALPLWTWLRLLRFEQRRKEDQ